MTRIEIGIGGLIAAIAGLGWGSSTAVNVALLALGAALILHGIYDVYLKPNVGLDKTLKRWLERHYWTVTTAKVPPSKFYFGVLATDLSQREVLISRERDLKGILAFTAQVELDNATVRAIATNLSTSEQQRLYKEIHVALASMHMGFQAEDFRKMTVQHALPIDDQLSEYSVDIKAKDVADGVIVARELCRKAVT